MLEFWVDSIGPDGLVIGRNGERSIPVGTTFHAIRRCRISEELEACRTEDFDDVQPVSLSLREVHWYGRVLDHVPGGHTAAVRLAGDGLLPLAEWLRRLPTREYLRLVAEDGHGDRHSAQH